MKMSDKRPDGLAILGLIVIAALLVVAWTVLTALDREVGTELWQAFAVVVGIVGGWVGKTVWSDKAAEAAAPEAAEPDAAEPSAPAVWPAAGAPVPTDVTGTGPASVRVQPLASPPLTGGAVNDFQARTDPRFEA